MVQKLNHSLAAPLPQEKSTDRKEYTADQRRQLDRIIRNTSESQPLTMSEIDAIRYQIQQCWSVPAGARDAEDLVVRVRVFLNSDGTIARPPEIVDSGRRDTFFLAAAESARRAVLKCTPLKNLPVEKFRQWQELTLTFNPRDMLGG